MKKLKEFYKLLMEIVSIWVDGNASSMGAAVAYYTIFAIAPLFVFVLVIAGFFFGHEAAKCELFGQIAGLVGPSGGEAIQPGKPTRLSAVQPYARAPRGSIQ